MDSTYTISVESAYKYLLSKICWHIILLRIPQLAKVGSCFGFRESKKDSAKLCGFRLQFEDSAYNLRVPLTVADSTTT